MNIVESIRRQTLSHRDKAALVEGKSSITYGQLLDRVWQLQQQLMQHGITPGQRIAFRCADGIDYVIGALALLAANAAVVPVTDSLTPSEIQDTISRIDVHGILTHNALATPDTASKVDEVFNFLPRQPQGTALLPAGFQALNAAFIRFSSGTTGASKGVVLSHRTILERTDAANLGLEITSNDVILWVLGMSHHFVVSILLFLRQGATIVIANQNFPFSIFETAVSVPVTFIYASPVHYYLLAMAASVTPQTLQHVRLAISTAMKMPRDISRAFADKFGFAPAEAYGIIEIGLPLLNRTPATGGEGTVGQILPAYQLWIRNPDAHGIGEVLIRGQGMFDAYFSPWQTREQCLEEGWFHTGDLGRLDSENRLCLLGRCKTVIVCAGMKVFPEEVEEVINATAGVKESLIYPQEHPQFGQIPLAQVVLQPGTDPAALSEEIRNRCREKLSSYKVPADISFVPSLAKTSSGKLIRHRPVDDKG